MAGMSNIRLRQSGSKRLLELKLESLNCIFPMLPIKQFDFDVCDFIPIAVEATNVDGVHVWGGARVAEWMDSADLAEPVLGNLVSSLIES